MNKTAVIIAGSIITILLSIAIVWYFFFYQKSIEYKPTIVKNQLSVTTADKKNILMTNIYGRALVTYPENGVGFARTSSYEMSYYPKDDGFIITLLDPNVESARTIAEQDFLKILNITATDACALKVSMGVPFSVNEEYSGKELSFHYCP